MFIGIRFRFRIQIAARILSRRFLLFPIPFQRITLPTSGRLSLQPQKILRDGGRPHSAPSNDDYENEE